MIPLETKNLTRELRGFRILDQVNLRITRGEIVALLGANGSGKTTLLRCLVGQLRPDSGHVLWFGASSCRRPAAHHLIGFAAHESRLYSELSARDNLQFAARMQGLPSTREHIAGVLANMDFGRWADLPVGRLSQGMRQRIALVRALVHDLPIVILDEPFAGLDLASRDWFENWLASSKASGRAICLTSHDPEQCRRVADRTLELRDGQLCIPA